MNGEQGENDGPGEDVGEDDPAAADEDVGEDDAAAADDRRVFRVHGVVVIDTPPGKLTRRTQLLVEDEEGCAVRLRIEEDNQFGGESKTLHLESQELVDLLRALELVAKRRGLVDPTGN